jgi:pimeloyl-ACP methyl ester carboxylesterase
MTTAMKKRRVLWTACLMLTLLAVAAPTWSAELPEEPTPKPIEEPDVTMKTLGGLQYWGDVYFYSDWRIQRNVFTSHYRLLDGNDYRRSWGTFKECLDTLEEIRETQQLPPMSGKAVLLIHGVIRSSKSMNALAQPLQDAGYTVFRFGYPSTQIKIEEAAEYLHRSIESLEGIDEINVIAHSMGGLVVRAYLMEHRDERLKRMVMLGVPNRGARLADRLKNLGIFHTIYGPAGQQLATGDDNLIAKLPTPNFEFAIIAGAQGTDEGLNPLVPGDDDGTVSVESARLPGATDFATAKCLHSFLMNSEKVIGYCVNFIKTGQLRAEGPRFPIPTLDHASAK